MTMADACGHHLAHHSITGNNRLNALGGRLLPQYLGDLVIDDLDLPVVQPEFALPGHRLTTTPS
jgi:hypothetical protein